MFDPGSIVEVEVTKWFAKSQGYDSVYIEGEVIHETDKAVLLETSDGDEVWIPLSVIL